VHRRAIGKRKRRPTSTLSQSAPRNEVQRDARRLRRAQTSWDHKALQFNASQSCDALAFGRHPVRRIGGFQRRGQIDNAAQNRRAFVPDGFNALTATLDAPGNGGVRARNQAPTSAFQQHAIVRHEASELAAQAGGLHDSESQTGLSSA
jgi:hypothetical protein